jgi:2-iminobutanoate/2-iminopropanoate deaminase
MPVTHLNPEGLPTNPAFSQGVVLNGPGRLVIVGGQDGIDADGTTVSDDLGEQSAQALRNVLTVLAAAGASQADVARLTIYIVGDGDIDAAYGAAQQVWGAHPTTVSVVRVAGLGRPEWLVEVDALAWVASA